jgi:hypothetical protein
LFADPYTGVWYESPEAILVYELNGKTLVSGQKYMGNFLETVVKDGAATGVFSTTLGGGGETTVQTDVVLDVQCINGEISQTKASIKHLQ